MEDKKEVVHWTEDEHKQFLRGLEKYGHFDKNKLEQTLMNGEHNDLNPMSVERGNNQFEVTPNTGNLHSLDPYECDECFREGFDKLFAQGVTYDGSGWYMPCNGNSSNDLKRRQTSNSLYIISSNT
ncbi:hypothetical protein PIB30_055346 [Stylosanthes scabra]|uniref:Uncharacterized protein n=1 Tax=Stylosanthes scabra TaxID=79078 RepID=A0ABU6VHZ0_9FABA|nr:hypothetical protein [Stylosanthes scabra]